MRDVWGTFGDDDDGWGDELEAAWDAWRATQLHAGSQEEASDPIAEQQPQSGAGQEADPTA